MRQQETFPYGPGATTVGLVCKDGVVLASEKRVSYGFYLMSKSGKKVFKVTNYIGVACAGIMADMQVIARTLAAEANLFTLETRRIMPVRSAVKLLANILFTQRIMPLIAQTIVGGIDDEGPHLYALDPLGSMIEDKYASVGSGAQVAIGVVESLYKDGLTVDDGRDIAVKAIRAAIERDAVSGDGIDVLMITNEGAREVFMPVK